MTTSPAFHRYICLRAQQIPTKLASSRMWSWRVAGHSDPRSAGWISILREHLPELKIWVVNVVDLMSLQSATEHPHGLSDRDYDALFTTIDKHIIFARHGYPSLIHRLIYRRTNRNLHVRGYNEEGTVTTSFDMRVPAYGPTS
jgi:XFP C-terminal domain